MTDRNKSDELGAVIKSALAGHRVIARVDMESLLPSKSNQASAWIWQAWLSDSPDAAIAALERALALEPQNRVARAGLEWARQLSEWTIESTAEQVAVEAPEKSTYRIDTIVEATFEREPDVQSDRQHDTEITDLIAEVAEMDDWLVTTSTSQQQRPVVLAVDDSPTVRKLVSMTLERVGYEVVTAADGVAALNLLADRRPVLILSDINMPRICGYKLCKLLKKHERTREIPVVMLSGKNGVFDRVRGQMVGCTDYINKPFASHDLIDKVRQYALVDTPQLAGY